MSHNLTHSVRLHRRVNYAVSFLLVIFATWCFGMYLSGRTAHRNAIQTLAEVDLRIEGTKQSLEAMRAVCEQSLQAKIFEAERNQNP